MKTFQEAYDIAQKWESEDFIGPGALVARALFKHINSMASPQVTDEQIAFENHVKNIFPHSWELDLASDRMTGYGSLQIRLMWGAWQARALLSAPPAAETRHSDDIQIILSALDRMDSARRILTSGNPTPTCNWGMLDTSDLRGRLTESISEEMPELPAGLDAATAAQFRDYGLKCRRATLLAPRQEAKPVAAEGESK